MAIERIFDIQGFSGGEADSPYAGPANSFYSGENIEIRADMGGIKLAGVMDDTLWTFDSKIVSLIHTSEVSNEDAGVITSLLNGKIYLSGTLKQTLNTGTTNHNIISGVGSNTLSGVLYYYLISRGDSGTVKVHRANAGLSTWNVSYKSFTIQTNDQSKQSYTITSGGVLYIAMGNKIVTISQSETVTDALILPTNEVIVGFTQFQNSFRIYTNSGNTGIQYLRNGVDEFPDYRQEWKNQPILAVVNDGALDYAILGFNENYSDLYLISGTQKQELRVNLEYSTDSRILGGSPYLGKYLSIREGLLYITGGLTGQSSNYGIYTFGNYYPGQAKSLVQQYSGSTKTFPFHTHSAILSYICDDDDTSPKVYQISHKNPPELGYATSGYVTSLVYQGVAWEEKIMKKIKISHKLETLSYYKIYCRTDLSSNWSLIKTVDNSTYGTKKRIIINANEINALNLGNFTEIQFKIELFAGTGSNYTPIIRRFTSFMEVVNND